MPIVNAKPIDVKLYEVSLLMEHNIIETLIISPDGKYNISYSKNGTLKCETGRITNVIQTNCKNTSYILFDKSEENNNKKERIFFCQIHYIQDITPNNAYDIALKHGFVGSVEDWLEYQRGYDGKSAYDVAVEEGFEGTTEEWLKSLSGMSAYDVAVKNGFKGSEEEWLNSLIGKSAYDYAVEKGYTGTIEEWLAMMGDSGSFVAQLDKITSDLDNIKKSDYISAHIISKEAYNKLDDVKASDLYFISDTYEIYYGSVQFNKYVTLYDSIIPANHVNDKLYLEKNTLEGTVFVDDVPIKVIKPIDKVFDSTSENSATSKAISLYVHDSIKEALNMLTYVKKVDYDKTSRSLTILHEDNTLHKIPLDNLGTSLKVGKSGNEYTIQLTDMNGKEIGECERIRVGKTITDIDYNENRHSIIIYFDGAKLPESNDYMEVNLSQLKDKYYGRNTKTIETLINSDNEIRSNIRISNKANNALSIESDGLFASRVKHDGDYQGFVNPQDIVFDKNLKMNVSIGAIHVAPGETKTLETKDKSLYEVLNMFLLGDYNPPIEEDELPTITQPSATVSFMDMPDSVEVGTEINPTYSISFDPGLYSFGPSTDVIPRFTVTDTNNNKSESSTDSFNTIMQEEDYSINVKINYSDSRTIPLTKLGREYPNGKILGSTIYKKSNTVKTYRKYFYGALPNKNDEIDSTVIRSLTHSDHELDNEENNSFEFNVPDGSMRIIIAIPSTIDDSNLDIVDKRFSFSVKSSFVKSMIEVYGANKHCSLAYNVYVSDKAEAIKSVDYIVKI